MNGILIGSVILVCSLDKTTLFIVLSVSSDSQILSVSQYLFVILLPDCGSVVNNTLKSPNYPEGYPDNMECEFKVPIPSRFRLKITFEYMRLPDLRNHYQCV